MRAGPRRGRVAYWRDEIDGGFGQTATRVSTFGRSSSGRTRALQLVRRTSASSPKTDIAARRSDIKSLRRLPSI